MSLTGFLQGLGIVSKTRTREETKAAAKSKYGVMEVGKTYIKVHAPSGEEALRIAGAEGMTPEGNRYIAANHQGGGIYYVEIGSW
jgi:hypothetical protein